MCDKSLATFKKSIKNNELYCRKFATGAGLRGFGMAIRPVEAGAGPELRNAVRVPEQVPGKLPNAKN